jgi:hypothetical protein
LVTGFVLIIAFSGIFYIAGAAFKEHYRRAKVDVPAVYVPPPKSATPPKSTAP